MATRHIGLVPLLLGAFALYQWQARRREQQEYRLASVKPRPEEVTTWEGEGGALKHTGSHLGPDPAMPA